MIVSWESSNVSRASIRVIGSRVPYTCYYKIYESMSALVRMFDLENPRTGTVS